MREPTPPISCAVHPHECGERNFDGGGAPHAYRFIPTCVGKTAVCATKLILYSGSSPRAWGGATFFAFVIGHGRFTPTCVGRTVLVRVRRSLVGPPPRAWGQRLPEMLKSPDAFGPPPRAWGQLLHSLPNRNAINGPPPRAWGQPLR